MKNRTVEILAPAGSYESMVAAVNAGADAENVVFDPDRIADCATFAQPVLPPVGIDYVLIGGEIAAKDCRAVNARLGRSIRK